MAEGSQKPIVIEQREALTIVTFHGAATDAEYAEYLHEMSAIIERNKHRYQRLAVINDASRWMKSSAVQRKQQADWMLKHDAEMRFKTAGVAFVITSALVRGGLNAVLWLAPLPCPHKIVGTMEEAQAWAKQALAEDVLTTRKSANG